MCASSVNYWAPPPHTPELCTRFYICHLSLGSLTNIKVPGRLAILQILQQHKISKSDSSHGTAGISCISNNNLFRRCQPFCQRFFRLRPSVLRPHSHLNTVVMCLVPYFRLKETLGTLSPCKPQAYLIDLKINRLSSFRLLASSNFLSFLLSPLCIFYQYFNFPPVFYVLFSSFSRDNFISKYSGIKTGVHKFC